MATTSSASSILTRRRRRSATSSRSSTSPASSSRRMTSRLLSSGVVAKIFTSHLLPVGPGRSPPQHEADDESADHSDRPLPVEPPGGNHGDQEDQPVDEDLSAP